MLQMARQEQNQWLIFLHPDKGCKEQEKIVLKESEETIDNESNRIEEGLRAIEGKITVTYLSNDVFENGVFKYVRPQILLFFLFV